MRGWVQVLFEGVPRFHISRPLSRKLTNFGFISLSSTTVLPTILNLSDVYNYNFPRYSKLTAASYLLENVEVFYVFESNCF